MYRFDWAILWSEWGLLLLYGLQVTLQLGAAALLLALVIGLGVGTVRWTGNKWVEPFCWLYIEFARNTPPLVQILFWYFSASFILPTPVVRWLIDLGLPFAAAVIALGLYHGAFMAEVFRSGFNAIHRGQYDAARALGLNFRQTFGSVILPQAVRVIVPPMTNEVIALVKGTSLAVAIGVKEIAYQTKYIETFSFRTMEALFGATVLYLLLCLGIAGIGRLLGTRFSRHVSKPS